MIPAAGLAHTTAFVLLDLSATGGCAVLELELPVLFAALERLAGSSQRPSPVTRLTRAGHFRPLDDLCPCLTRQPEEQGVEVHAPHHECGRHVRRERDALSRRRLEREARQAAGGYAREHLLEIWEPS